MVFRTFVYFIQNMFVFKIHKKPAVNDRLVKCNTLKGAFEILRYLLYIIPANTDAPTTVKQSGYGNGGLLIAPSTAKAPWLWLFR